jgi:hypothetical protein
MRSMSEDQAGSHGDPPGTGAKLFHAGVIATLLLSPAIIYYIGRLIALDAFLPRNSFLTGVHDIHRTFSLIPTP